MLNGIYQMFQHWGEQTAWIYSDPHFGDKDLDKGICGRPSTEEQIASINACVGRKDTLIILGDVGDIEAVRKLRAGRKVLIMGNHDSGRTNYEKNIIEEEPFDYDKYTKEQVIKIMREKYPGWKIWVDECYGFHSPFHYWVAVADNNLFDEVYEGALIVGEKLILSHEPVDIPWVFNIHGHDHAGTYRANHLNVCSDVIGYKPVNFNQFLKSGAMSKIQTIHRETIDKATERKKKRGNKKNGNTR